MIPFSRSFGGSKSGKNKQTSRKQKTKKHMKRNAEALGGPILEKERNNAIIKPKQNQKKQQRVLHFRSRRATLWSRRWRSSCGWGWRSWGHGRGGRGGDVIVHLVFVHRHGQLPRSWSTGIDFGKIGMGGQEIHVAQGRY
jgi:hypothetical protein